MPALIKKSHNFTVKLNKKRRFILGLRLSNMIWLNPTRGMLSLLRIIILSKRMSSVGWFCWLYPHIPIPISPDGPLIIKAGFKPTTRDGGGYWVTVTETEDQPGMSSGI